MKKQILNSETRELIMELELSTDDPNAWDRALRAYEFECETVLVESELQSPSCSVASVDLAENEAPKVSLWSKIKGWFTK